MALTATAVKKTKDVLLKNLGISKSVVIAASPNRANISYDVKLMDKNRSFIEYFQWIVDDVIENRRNAKRVIVYCQTVNQCHKLYSALCSELGEANYPDVKNRRERFLEMLHSNTPERVKNAITYSMTQADGCVRVLVCTIAFGMGINCKDVAKVVHLGPSKNVEAYVQESGRCGRQGEDSMAVIYFLGRMLTKVDQDMRHYVNLSGSTCRRVFLLKQFDLSKNELNCAQSYIQKHDCCDLCAQQCTCGADECKFKYVSLATEPSTTSVRARTVTIQQRSLLYDKLIILRKELYIPLFEKFLSHTGEVDTPSVPTFFAHFSAFQILQVQQNAHCLFSLGDINRLVEIWNKEHAIMIHKILGEVFDDMEPLVEGDIPQARDEEDDSFEDDEWEQLMDDSLNYMSMSDAMDISSFDYVVGMPTDDDDVPCALEEALEFVRG